MMRTFLRTTLSVLLCATTLVSASHAADVKVIATTSDLGYLFETIGGDHVEVKTFAKGYQDPHYLQAKPSYISRMRGADLLAYVGLELEIGWLPLLVEGSRNADLAAGGKGSLSLAQGLEIRDVPHGQVDRSKGDLHPLGNPHYWLDPRNQRVMAETVSQALSRLDPSHAPDFEANRAAFDEKLSAAIARWEAQLAPVRGKRIVCYHTQWEYLTDWMGLEVIDYVENRPGIPPSPRHLHDLEARIKSDHIPLILMSDYFDAGSVEKIAAATGTRLLVLPPSIGAEDDTDDVFALFDHLVSEVVSVLGGDTNG